MVRTCAVHECVCVLFLKAPMCSVVQVKASMFSKISLPFYSVGGS